MLIAGALAVETSGNILVGILALGAAATACLCGAALRLHVRPMRQIVRAVR